MVTGGGGGDRAVGCLLGLAVGDALGAAVEFRPPGSFPPVTGFRGGGPHGLAAGEWTDDTAMALALADSILRSGWDLDDQARRYLAWWETGAYSVTGTCFDIGNTTAAGLRRFRTFGDARTSGLDDERSAGNGSIMRLAPVVLAAGGRYPDDVGGLARLALESSIPTHRAPQALSACAALAVALAGLVGGEPRTAVIDPAWGGWQALRRVFPLHPAVDRVVGGSFLRRSPPEIRGTGYVVDCLEAALWAFAHHHDFAAVVLAAVNLGDDADTTGAVAGQLGGAAWGAGGIPTEWREQLAWREHIEQVAESLWATSV